MTYKITTLTLQYFSTVLTGRKYSSKMIQTGAYREGRKCGAYLTILKLTSQGPLHYLWSVIYQKPSLN